MYRLVYFDPQAGYGTIDSDIYSNIIDSGRGLKVEGKDVICIVNYDGQEISHKSNSYNTHRDNVDRYIFDYEFLNT